MPSLTKRDIDLILKTFNIENKFSTFIETGTYHGNTVYGLSNFFEKIYTVEYSKEIYNNLMKRKNPPNIEFYNSDSNAFLKKILPDLNDKTKDYELLFFLDAHWAGISTGFFEKDCPLLDELNTIKDIYKKKKLVIIDDYNKFGVIKSKEHHKNEEHKRIFGPNGKIEDWSDITLENVLKCFNDTEYKIINNRLILNV